MKTNDTFEQETELLIPAGKFLEKKIPDPIPILPGLINDNTIVLLSGDTGAGKSWFCLHLAYAIAAGKECFPWGIPSPVPVLYVDGEMGEKLFQSRLLQIRRRDLDPLTPENAHVNLHILGKAWSKGMDDLDKSNTKQYLSRKIAEKHIKLVIIDNLDTLCPSALSKAAEWKQLIDWVQRLSSKKVAIILVHHNNKKGVQHGSSEKTRQMHVMLSLKKSKEPKVKDQSVFLLSMEKERDKSIGLAPETRFVVRTEYDAFGEDPTTWVIQENLYSHQDEGDEEAKNYFLAGKTGKEIAQLMGISEPTVSRIRARLVEKGLLT